MLFRQGDVLIRKINEIPPSTDLIEIKRDKGRVVLAYGEVTGHAHAIKEKTATLFRSEKLNRVFLAVIDGGASVQHEEHAAIPLDPGNYEIIHQREYVAPELTRQVAD